MNIGDVVKLKSGGPEMTVDGFTRWTGRARCYWYSYYKGGEINGYFKENHFNVKALDIIKGV